jgi:hypothetical protein
MNAPVRKPLVAEVRADPIEIFYERAQAMASLWQAGEILLCDAVDRVQQAAEAYGLVIALGQDEVQRRMAEVFAAVPTIGLPKNPMIPDDQYADLDSTFAAARVADTKQARKPRDPRLDRLRRLMDAEISPEGAYAALNPDPDQRPPGDVPEVTLKAAEYLLQQGDADRWRAWFDGRIPQERAAILQHLEDRKRRRCP